MDNEKIINRIKEIIPQFFSKSDRNEIEYYVVPEFIGNILKPAMFVYDKNDNAGILNNGMKIIILPTLDKHKILLKYVNQSVLISMDVEYTDKNGITVVQIYVPGAENLS